MVTRKWLFDYFFCFVIDWGSHKYLDYKQLESYHFPVRLIILLMKVIVYLTESDNSFLFPSRILTLALILSLSEGLQYIKKVRL